MNSQHDLRICVISLKTSLIHRTNMTWR